jgi:anaerobic selenocysteine-containing dehydrogenase
VKLRDGEIVSVRGDADDVFSHGFICPKGVSLKALHEDPDRLTRPLVRDATGELVEASWDQAFERVDELLTPILAEHGRDAVGAYLGNPSAHSLGAAIYGRATLRALGSKNVFTASTVDQMPKHVSAGLMFGAALSIPVPDVDRCMHLLMLGANPLASNGSLMTAPDMRGRLRALRERGGKLVVVDPRRSRTAEIADEHHFIQPGTDAHLLFGLVHVLFDEELTSPVADCNGVDEVRALAADFSPEAVSPVCGIAPDEIRRMARELAAASPACVYGRIGTTTQRFGTLASWLVDVLNALTGNLDRPGGAMWPLAAAGQSNARGGRGGRGLAMGRWKSRVRGLEEVIGELPVSTLVDEIETPGEGQVRALITVAGNPARSTPNSARLNAALAGLDALVCVDFYVNETTRHAEVILPVPPPLAKAHYDIALYQLAIRNVANYSPPIIEPPDGMPQEWEILLRLTGILSGQGPHADIEAIDDFVASAVAQQLGAELESVNGRRGPERVLDLMLRGGPYELTLADLEANPHGIDLGPLEPRLPDMLKTPSGMIELAPEPIVADVARLRESLAERRNGGMVLVGRRTLRSNNSWMHNLEPLVRGPVRYAMHVHPDDASRLGLIDGGVARVRSRAGEIEAPVEVTDAVMPGVVSIPHGWGHDAPGARLPVAAKHAGVNVNALTDELDLDPLSGNAVLNGVPVEVAPG